MNKQITVSVEIPQDALEKAVAKATKLNTWQIESAVNDEVNKQIAQATRKYMKEKNIDLGSVIEQVMDSLDWNELVRGYIEALAQDD